MVTSIGAPQITGDEARVTFEAIDAASYLTRAEYSVNGGEWITVYADDGISDSPRERYTVNVPLTKPGEYTVTLRVFDVNGNTGNARATVHGNDVSTESGSDWVLGLLPSDFQLLPSITLSSSPPEVFSI